MTRGRLVADGLALVASASLAALAPDVGARFARVALVEFGPNDAAYVQGFRAEWERDGRTRFHWTTPAASVHLPVHARGPGHRLRLRARRHFTEPAHVRLAVEGRPVASFDLAADVRVPYRLFDLPVPPLDGRHPLVVTIEAPADRPSSLGIALDWLAIESPPGGLAPLRSATLRAAGVAAALWLALRLAGAGTGAAVSGAAALSVALALGFASEIVAADHILRLGAIPLGVAASLGALFARRATRSEPDRRVAAALTALTCLAAALRLLLVLHPRFYYPDVKIHGLFVWQLARRGFHGFMAEFIPNQYRYSLGLQNEGGHWYAFPYPPGFYVLCWPLTFVEGLRYEEIAALVAAFVNALEIPLLYVLARVLGLGASGGLLAAGFGVLLPIFTARLGLAYFPALVGHFVDATILTLALAWRRRLAEPRVALLLAALVSIALVTYTQSLLNLGLLFPVLAGVVAYEGHRSGQGFRRAAAFAGAGLLGALLSVALFYHRYIPMVQAMREGREVAEEQILRDKARAPVPPEERLVADQDDPYSAPHFDALRGLRKAAWRLWIFYGPFGAAVVAGLVVLARSADRERSALVMAWASVYLLLNFASGSLPGPNLVRYNKDLEAVAPLFACALAAAAGRLDARHRLLGAAFLVAWTAFAVERFSRSLTSTFVLEGWPL